jgi:hypothetical protein
MNLFVAPKVHLTEVSNSAAELESNEAQCCGAGAETFVRSQNGVSAQAQTLEVYAFLFNNK